jgi:pyruvate dehydrogenase E2 component (dihydrolipoamide acetyltransferase)
MEITLPKLGANMDSAVITKWFKSEGDRVDKNEAIAEVATDKTNVEIEAPEAGFLIKQYFKEDDDVPVGAILAHIGSEESKPVVSREQGNMQEEDKRIPASPSARKLARQLHINLADVKGSGPNGRIVREDVVTFSASTAIVQEEKQPENETKQHPEDNKVKLEILKDNRVENIEVYSLKRIEKISGERMMQSLQSTAQLTIMREVDVTEASVMLNSLKKVRKERISFTALLILAVSRALQVHKRFNGKFENGQINIPSGVHMNVAVATDNGLMVPIIKDVQEQSLIKIANNLNSLVDRARVSKLIGDDLENGNFTLTNLGASGVDTFTPILFPGQVGILGVGRILERPWVYEGNIAARSILSLSLTWNHQAVDGYPAAQFLKTIAENLETPSLML